VRGQQHWWFVCNIDDSPVMSILFPIEDASCHKLSSNGEKFNLNKGRRRKHLGEEKVVGGDAN